MEQSDDLTREGLVDELSGDGVPSTSPSIIPLRPVVTTATYERDLTPADIVALNTLPRGSAPCKPLQRIRSSHHALARCMALGLTNVKAAMVTGYSPDRIKQLNGDPTFKQLVEEYRADTKSIVADYAIRLREFGLDAMEELHERLVNNPESFSIPALMDAVTKVADRIGHGAGSTVSHNLNVSLIDRPPREDFEDWQKRRRRELTLQATEVEPPARTAD